MQQKGWKFVERTGEGVSVTGWMRRSDLKKSAEDVGIGRSGGCSGDHAGGQWSEGWGPGGRPPNLYEGPATVIAGSAVFSDPPKGEWAVFTAEGSVRVRYVPGEKWVTLREVPGLDGSPPGSPWLNGYVAVDHVVFPAAEPTTQSP